ncbi:hypothetical protein PoB_007434700 [Plakobranchus ocellatus]|uniref:Uncharacterized protein n=1 Tax=Plakobranchus ocellatus TaxID=259542 RepID=A0AAV4DV01_9GAST|nr:hypothetical protein PoB_007434700 [Plakobranchus ocellatus]
MDNAFGSSGSGIIGKEYTLCYTEGSAKGGVQGGGYGVLVRWPDGTITRTSEPKAASGSNDDRTQKFNEARPADDYIEVLDRFDAVQLSHVRAGNSLLRSDKLKRKWAATTVSRLCGEQTEDCSQSLIQL